tara:strand:- start:63 stop:551 length:489 start_codon:yes stop_codon:yes gene_type:complete
MTQGCNQNNTVCESRVTDINVWTDEYQKLRNEYMLAYKAYLEDTLAGNTPNNETRQREESMKTAQKKIQDHLADLNDNNKLNNQTIQEMTNQLDNQTTNIQTRNNDISNQNLNINKLNISLLSKERQIEYTNERNRNRRIMVAVLIIINLILISVAYMLYNK